MDFAFSIPTNKSCVFCRIGFRLIRLGGIILSIGRIEIVNNKKTYVPYENIGKIEIIDGKKAYVPYSNSNSGECEPPSESTDTSVDNVQDLVLEKSPGNLTLTWKDPDDVVFNGNTIAKWAGTKVVRKIGSLPTNIKDGVLIADNTVKDQYSSVGFQDADLVENTEYNYALFPYTTKDIYTLSDLNRVSGSPGYNPILAKNTWKTIHDASVLGIAKDLWSIGDEKDGFQILAFDHDDLADGSGKAGITFALKENSSITSSWGTPTANLLYVQSNYYKKLTELYENFNQDITPYIKKVKKKCLNTYASTASVSDYEMHLFPFSIVEIFGTEGGVIGERFYGEGKKYENSESVLLSSRPEDNYYPFSGKGYMSRTFTYAKTFWYVNGQNKLSNYGMQYDYINIRYGFCI